jgi:long-chain acyl-CoA synthetase
MLRGMPADTIVHRLLEQGATQPERPAFYTKVEGAWLPTSWREYARDVRRAGKALIALGMPVGGTVALLGFNRPEWIIASVAAMAVGGAGAGIYTTCSPSEVRYIVTHAESLVCVVENEQQWKKIEAERHAMPALRHVVTMRGAPKIDDPMVMTWDEFLARGDAVPDERFQDRVAALEPRQLAVLIYTSGTTGPPKGVMLCHQNLTFTADLARELNEIQPTDCTLSYLPLSHIAEQMFSIHVPITAGAAVYFAESIEKVPDNLKEVQPTLFFGVPRIWEKFHAGISAKMSEATGVKRKILDFAMATGREVTALRCKGKEPKGLLAVRYAIAKKLVFSKLKPAVGLGRARRCVSGAAPIAKEVLEFFGALDVIIAEVYGQSEDTGPTSTNRTGHTKFGTVGPAFPGVEVKLGDDGEILVRGPNVFLGYYKDPAATAEALKDGWLHSGDLGSFDEDGYLTITGRKKEIIITAGGKNVAPKNIEAALKNHPLVSEAVVIGDRRKYLTALVTLDPDAAAKFARERGLPPDAPHELAEVRAEVQRTVDEVNRELARVETVKKFTILPRSFTIEHGELTPTLKVKRKAVDKNFATQIEGMYQD